MLVSCRHWTFKPRRGLALRRTTSIRTQSSKVMTPWPDVSCALIGDRSGTICIRIEDGRIPRYGVGCEVEHTRSKSPQLALTLRSFASETFQKEDKHCREDVRV